jgi:hypothetical protein
MCDVNMADQEQIVVLAILARGAKMWISLY